MTEEHFYSGLARRRRRRLPDEETEHRMLRTAMAMVQSTGLTVSLDHIRFEDVIRDANVARSAVYRRWPFKDLFFSDMLRELARTAAPVTLDQAGAAELTAQVVSTRLDWFRTPEQRHALLAELLRQSTRRDFYTLHGSAAWRTYLAIHATFVGLADGLLRDDLRAALAEAEHEFISQLADSYERLARLLGYRLRPELNATFDNLASLTSAVLRGMAVIAAPAPDIAMRRLSSAPFGTVPAEWSPPALGAASIVLAFIEPDPTIEWDEDRITAVRAELQAGSLPN